MSWYFENGPESDVVVSTRIRFARNISGHKFNSIATKEDEEKVLDIFKNNNVVPELKFIRLSDLDELMQNSLVEKHVISRDILNVESAGILLNADEDVCVMINEEDHVRIQAMNPGLELEKTLKTAEDIDNKIAEKVEYAYSDLYGYLTTCPTNVGTGLRASVMLHLPALRITGRIGRVLDVVNKVNLDVRGVYGEGTEAIGDMYQVSNKVSLGVTNQEIISSVKSIVNKIIEQERNAREYLMTRGIDFEDRVCRDYGILTSARKLSYDECAKLVSMVKLGVDLGIIKEIDSRKVNEISIATKPATLQKCCKEILGPKERDEKRADIIKMIVNK
mgnify:FL=1